MAVLLRYDRPSLEVTYRVTRRLPLERDLRHMTNHAMVMAILKEEYGSKFNPSVAESVSPEVCQ